MPTKFKIHMSYYAGLLYDGQQKMMNPITSFSSYMFHHRFFPPLFFSTIVHGGYVGGALHL